MINNGKSQAMIAWLFVIYKRILTVIIELHINLIIFEKGGR